MAIVAKKGATYPACPGGSHIGVCIDVVDLGMVKSTYSGKTKTQHKIRIIWSVAELREDGRPYQVSKRYTLSLHEKSALRKDLESWRGKPFTDAQLEGWDVEGVIGVGAMLSVVENAQGGSIYANVAAIMLPPKVWRSRLPIRLTCACRIARRNPARLTKARRSASGKRRTMTFRFSFRGTIWHA